MHCHVATATRAPLPLLQLRRLKSDVAKSLPPKTETLLYVGLRPMQRELYKSLLLRDVQAVLTGGSAGAGTSAVSSGRLSNVLMQLRKACGHPYLFDGWEDRSLDPMGEHVVQNCGKLVVRRCADMREPLVQATVLTVPIPPFGRAHSWHAAIRQALATTGCRWIARAHLLPVHNGARRAGRLLHDAQLDARAH